MNYFHIYPIEYVDGLIAENERLQALHLKRTKTTHKALCDKDDEIERLLADKKQLQYLLDSAIDDHTETLAVARAENEQLLRRRKSFDAYLHLKNQRIEKLEAENSELKDCLDAWQKRYAGNVRGQTAEAEK